LRLAKQQIGPLAALIAPPEKRTAVESRLRENSIDSWLVLPDDQGELRAAVAIAPISPEESQLRRLFVRDGEAPEAGGAVIAEAVAEAGFEGASRMMTRVHDKNFTVDYGEALLQNGFVLQGARVEFKTPLAELPQEDESGLTWRVTEDVAEAAALLRQVAVGDPGSSDDEDADAFIRAEHSDPETVARMEIGALDGLDAAFLLAEVDPERGWSTLSYFGVTPEVRGRGLGIAAHRHGFTMMRAMGGKLYHGGCSAENQAMIRIFAANGCREFARMREWNLKLEVDDD